MRVRVIHMGSSLPNNKKGGSNVHYNGWTAHSREFVSLCEMEFGEEHVWVCVHVCAEAHICVQEHVHVRSIEVNFRCCSSGSTIFFGGAGSLWNSMIRLVWLVNQLWGWTCLHLLTAGSQEYTTMTSILNMSNRNQIQVLKFVWQALFWLNYHSLMESLVLRETVNK